VILAFLVSPALVPIVLFLPLGAGVRDNSEWELIAALLFVSLYALPIAYAAELVLGIPAWLLFRHFKVRSLWAFAIAGAGIGWLAMFLLSIGNGVPTIVLHDMLASRLALCYMAAGAIPAILFRQILFSPWFDFNSVTNALRE
jgi:hypothetical protein